MKREEIRDICESEIIFEKSKEGVTNLGNLTTSATKADVFNANKRLYNEKIVSREYSSLGKKLKDSGVAGQLSHPVSGSTELDKVAVVLTDAWYDKDEKLGYVKMAVLNTSAGRNLKAIIDSKLMKLGVSTRGYGSVDKSGHVKDDFSLQTIDIVENPSAGYDVAGIDASKLHESGNEKFIKAVGSGSRKEETIDKEILLELFHGLKSLGYHGNFEEWKASGNLEHLLADAKARLLHFEMKQAGKIEEDLSYENWLDSFDLPPERKSDKLQEERKRNFFYSEALNSGYKGTREQYEEEMEKVRKIEKMSIGEEQSYRGAVYSGYKGSAEDHLRLVKKKRQQIKEAELSQYKDALFSGYRGTFEDWQKLIKKD